MNGIDLEAILRQNDGMTSVADRREAFQRTVAEIERYCEQRGWKPAREERRG